MVQPSTSSHPREPQSSTRRAAASLALGSFSLSHSQLMASSSSPGPGGVFSFAKWKQICSQAARRAKNSCCSLGYARWAVMEFEHPELSRRAAEVVLCWHWNPLLPRWKRAGFGGLEPLGRERSPCRLWSLQDGEHHHAHPGGLCELQIGSMRGFVGFGLPERRHRARKVAESRSVSTAEAARLGSAGIGHATAGITGGETPIGGTKSCQGVGRPPAWLGDSPSLSWPL